MPTDILTQTSSHAARSLPLRGLTLALAVVALDATPQLVAAQQNRQVAQLANSNQPAGMSPTVADGGATLVMYTVRSDLRQLVMAQEAYWTTKKSYATDVAALST